MWTTTAEAAEIIWKYSSKPSSSEMNEQLWTAEGCRGKKWGKITQFSIQESTQRRRRLVCRQAKWVCEVDGLCCWECVAVKRKKKVFAAGRKKCVESREIAANERAYLIFFTHKIWMGGKKMEWWWGEEEELNDGDVNERVWAPWDFTWCILLCDVIYFSRFFEMTHNDVLLERIAEFLWFTLFMAESLVSHLIRFL